MPNIPCQFSVSNCDCLDFPISNYTSDGGDVPIFIGEYNQPPTTGTFFAPGCFGTCESLVSQEAADECAARNAFECSLDGAPRTGNPTPHGIPPHAFRSTVQECSADCGDGNTTTVVEPAGTVVSATQADADARAHGLACKRVKELLVCFVTTSPLTAIHADQFASIPIVASGGNGDYEFTLTSGSLPAGMTLDAVGLILGTPTGSGTSTFQLTVADTAGGTATKTFTLEVLAACSPLTDWCANPGTCRVRIQNFDSGDWVAGTFTPDFGNPCDVTFLLAWDGAFANTGIVGANVCLSYSKGANPNTTPSFTVDFDDGTGQWSMNYTTTLGTMFFALGPVDPSPLGTYTRDPAFSCTGPASLVLESYSP